MSSITIMTTQGRAQLAAAVANAQSFPSAKIAVGDGNGATYVPNEAQVGLVHEVWRGNATVARTDDRVIFQAVVPAEVGGFTVREVGVLIGEIGAEQLFIISQHPSTEKIAAPANGSGPLPVTIAFSASAAEQAVLPIGASDNATLQLSRAPHITVDGLVTEPPAEPVDGALYAIDTGAAGLFVGKGGWLVERVAGAWIYKQPPEKSVIRLAADGSWHQRNGADWVALTFEDTSILWAQIQDPPSEFPPSAHNHDDRYFTETETTALLAGKSDTGHLHDDRYLRLTGGQLSGYIQWLNNIGLQWQNAAGSFTGGSAGVAFFKGADDTLYQDNYNGDWLFRRAGYAVTLYLGSDGKVGVNTTSPGARQHIKEGSGSNIVPGGTWAGIAANTTDASDNHGFAVVARFATSGATVLDAAVAWNGSAEAYTSLFAIKGDGSVNLRGDAGSATKVMTGGANPAWKTLAELGVGKKIIAIGTANSGDTITFATAEPDTSYSGVVINGVGNSSASTASTLGFGSLSSKGTGSCVVNSGNTSGSPGMTATNPVFYIIFRNT